MRYTFSELQEWDKKFDGNLPKKPPQKTGTTFKQIDKLEKC